MNFSTRSLLAEMIPCGSCGGAPLPVYPHGYLAAGIAERNADVSHRPTCLLVKHHFNLLTYQGYVEEM